MIPVPELKDVDVIFPAGARVWMPKMEDIPEEFKARSTVWNRIFSQWFYNGLPASTEFVPKPEVHAGQALRALQATLGSFAPKHEHKEAAVAFMLSEWFSEVRNWDQPVEP